MNISLMEILACPYCEGKLGLHVDYEENTEILSGSLRCVKCVTTYPIVDSIPNFLKQ